MRNKPLTILEDKVMLINKHDCYSVLFEMQSQGKNVQEDISKFMKNHDYVPPVVITYLKEQNYPTIEFYLRLNNKAHKVIKEILTCDNKPVSNYIKIATSLITQATITLEHTCKDDIQLQNRLIEALYLKELSKALNIYFAEGDYTKLVETVNRIKQDVKLILDN